VGRCGAARLIIPAKPLIDATVVIRLCDALLPLNHSPSGDMEDVPVLVLA